jgi:hypothetical protein
MFLEESEWRTYCRRKPVRYIRTAKAVACQNCGRPGSEKNPLQNAHIIGFDLAVIELGLTPDYLDSNQNIVTACRRQCNKSSELDLQGSMQRLRSLGVKKLSSYLPATILDFWKSCAKQKST